MFKVIVVKECDSHDAVEHFVDRITETGKENITIEVSDESKGKVREIEIKYKTELDMEGFKNLVSNTFWDIFRMIQIPNDTDTYWINEVGTIVRHRFSFNKHELTVKSRDGQYQKRDEININLGNNSVDLINAWLVLAGFVKEFTIIKNIFVYDLRLYDDKYQIAYYEVENSPFKFIEIEYIGTKNINEDDTLLIMHKLASSLGLKPEDNVNKSIYNMYKEWREIQ